MDNNHSCDDDRDRFVTRNNSFLYAEFQQMRATVDDRLRDRAKRSSTDNQSPKAGSGTVLTVAQHELHPHTYRVVDSGFRRYQTTDEIDCYAKTLSLADVKWAGAVNKDEAAAGALLHLIGNDVRNVTLSKCGDNRATQEAFEDLPSHIFATGKAGVPRIETFLGRSCLRTWLCGIAFRLVINAVNSAHNKRMVNPNQNEDENFPEAEAPEVKTSAMQPELTTMVTLLLDAATRAALDLTPKQRIVFKMVYFMGIPQNQTAKMLDCTAAAINQNLKAARQVIADKTAPAVRRFSEDANLQESVAQHLVIDFLKHFNLLDGTKAVDRLDADSEDVQGLVNDFLKQHVEFD